MNYLIALALHAVLRPQVLAFSTPSAAAAAWATYLSSAAIQVADEGNTFPADPAAGRGRRQDNAGRVLGRGRGGRGGRGVTITSPSTTSPTSVMSATEELLALPTSMSGPLPAAQLPAAPMPAPVALNTPAAGPALDVVLNALITTAEKQGTHASFIAVDSGCARDVESDDGLAGFFGERRPTGMRLKTGSGERCPAAFEGSHRHFIITADLHVLEEVRHNVICAAGTRFKRSLYAPRTATARDIETTLGRRSRLTFCSDGRVVPLRDTGQGYYLVRFFERSHA